MRHSMSKDTPFNGETTPRHTFLLATRNVCPLEFPESCVQNMGIRLLENHSLGAALKNSRRRREFLEGELVVWGTPPQENFEI